MLELRNIVKDYVSSNNVTHALKGLSVTFRKNEFVSILGASGCGKTTLLNIIGGLDRYTSGDLLILGKSTKDFKDRDWDTYRNHSIGFVFQTYNLISHQNILKNVELALTISGVSKEERKQRAYHALKIVGLEGMEKKKPNQLSGGQCQRVAIARALINNPEILLADEPTGALDSETSVQIMDLLKEVASDRLVIMVTHNPDLANRYSTRIINMSDGLLTHDSNPFNEKDAENELKTQKSPENHENFDEKSEVSKGKKKKTSMSLLTSIGLSTSNLFSKMKRTVLVVIAGSIGIIGVSTVLAASRGVKDYIKDLQNDMLSAYPISIAEESVDYTALITGLSNSQSREKYQFDPKDPKVGVDSMISYLMDAYSDMTNVKTNTIDERLLTFIQGAPKEEIGAITYSYGIDPTNNVFGKWKATEGEEDRFYSFNGLTQRYISELKTVAGFEAYASFVDLFTSFMHQLPAEKDYILDQYEVLAGEYKTGEDDLVLVVDQDTTLTDVVLAQMGVFDHDSFLNVAKCAMKEQELKKSDAYQKDMNKEQREAAIQAVRDEFPYSRDFSYDELINRDFYYFPQDAIYNQYSAIDFTAHPSFIKTTGSHLDRFVELSLTSQFGMTGLVGTSLYDDAGKYKEQKNIVCLNLTRAYHKEFSYDVKSLEDLDGLWIALPYENAYNLIADGILNKIAEMSELEIAALLNANVAFSFAVDKGDLSKIKYDDGFKGLPSKTLDINWDDKTQTVQYFSYEARADESWITNPAKEDINGRKMKISSILRLKESNKFGTLSRGLYYSKAFGDKFMNDSKNAKLSTAIKNHMINVETAYSVYNKAFVTYPYFDHTKLQLRDDGRASTLNTDLSESFSDIFMSFTGSSSMEKNATHLRSICGLKSVFHYDENEKFETATFETIPKEIKLYPKSFEGKDKITRYLDKWNSEEVLPIEGAETKAQRDDLTYSDTISLIASVIDTFIDAITIALVVFTSLSLVVSCFMIAVITYISVVERIKEIGVIRSLGGRKRDVAGLFVMETLITGLLSGLFGITVTYIIQVIVNAVLKVNFGLAIIKLTIPTALLMVGVSVALSVLSGLLPSQSAAHKDPVVALRSNE